MDLNGQEGEVRFTLEITRADTGAVETVEMVGKIGDSEQPKEEEVNESLVHLS